MWYLKEMKYGKVKQVLSRGENQCRELKQKRLQEGKYGQCILYICIKIE
jgi:hypothetical protein